jgi:hypothetical protein
MDSPTDISVLGYPVSKSKIVFFAQIVIVYIVIITSLFNLTFRNGDNQLWTALLSSSIGYILPAPKLRK